MHRPAAPVSIAPMAVASRAIDWRFLLPPTGRPGLGRVLLAGATDETATSLGQTGLAAEILRDRCPPGAADAAVVLRDTDLAVDAIARALAPGGVLYWEIARTRWSRLRVSPSVARAALREAGMTPVESYWVTSGAAGPSMHLPLSHDGAVRWYFAAHHGPSGWLRRWLGRVLRSLAQGRGTRLERFVPAFAVTARRDGGTAAADSEGGTALAGADVPAWAGASDARSVLLGGGEGPWSRVVLLPFGRGSDRPSGVIKVARSNAYAGALAAEQQVLASLRATASPAVAASVPEPLGSIRVLGQAGSAETYRPGASIAARSRVPGVRRAARRADLERAADWLQALHDATTAGSADLGPSGPDLAGLLARYGLVFGRDAAEERWLGRLRDGAAVGAAGPRIPQVLRHRDFGPWNVLIDDGQVSVIDWEVAGTGPALVDLLYLVVHWCWIVAGASTDRAEIEVLRRLVAGDGMDWYVAAGRSVIRGHAARLGLAADTVATLFAWTFVEQALDRHDRLAAIGDASATDRASNRYVRYIAALAASPGPAGAIAGWLDPGPQPRP